MLTSDGVVVFPDVNLNPQTGRRDERAQVGFSGAYLPTVPADPAVGRSAYPAERDPRLMLQPYSGDLGFDAGAPLSVYTLDQRQIDRGALAKFGDPLMLRVGESRKLPDGTTVEFVGTRPWVTLAIRHDPGETIVLAGAAALLVGLLASLTGKRRRIWFRVNPSGVVAGGLPRSDYAGFQAEFDSVVGAARAAVSIGHAPPDRSEGTTGGPGSRLGPAVVAPAATAVPGSPGNSYPAARREEP
jgi:cytochrome c biogenesis protein